MTEMPADGRSAEYRSVVLRTYRYLRLGIVALVVLLSSAVTLEIISSKVRLGSVSAYYYSPAHAVFVASLCGIGACLIVYRGQSDLEDAILNGCGFLAFVVAFIPTRPSEARPCNPTSQFCSVARSTVEANMFALLIVGALVLTLAFVVSVRKRKAPPDGPPVSRGVKVAYVVLLAGFLALAIFFFWRRPTFLTISHYTAAITLFVGIAAVTGLNAYRLGRKGAPVSLMRRGPFNLYAVTFYAMGASTLVIWGAHQLDWLPNWIFYLEASIVAEFATFWILQTVELWNEPPPPIPLPKALDVMRLGRVRADPSLR